MIAPYWEDSVARAPGALSTSHYVGPSWSDFSGFSHLVVSSGCSQFWLARELFVKGPHSASTSVAGVEIDKVDAECFALTILSRFGEELSGGDRGSRSVLRRL